MQILIFVSQNVLIVQEDIAAIFQKADKDNSGTLTVKEFQEVLNDICERYPQVELYLKNKKMSNLVDLLKESKGNGVKESIEVDIEEFKSALSQVDTDMKNLPATAQVLCRQDYLCSFYVFVLDGQMFKYLMSYVQRLFQVASQQGVYLAKCFNRMEECEKNPEGPLRFRGEGRHRFHPFR